MKVATQFPKIITSVPIATPAPIAPATPQPNEPTLHRWTPAEYVKMSDAGVFVDARVELIDGVIFDVPSQSNAHVAAISRTTRLLVLAFDESYWVTVRSTVRLLRDDMPDPDFAVRPGPASSDNDVQPLPSLVIEVSDKTLLFDQIVKSSLYAANGIQDYWVLNVIDRQLEIYRDPVPDPSRRHGFRYATVNTFKSGGKISPLTRPDVVFEVDRMLP